MVIVCATGPGQQLQVQGCHFHSLGQQGTGDSRVPVWHLQEGLGLPAGAGLWAVGRPFTLLQVDGCKQPPFPGLMTTLHLCHLKGTSALCSRNFGGQASGQEILRPWRSGLWGISERGGVTLLANFFVWLVLVFWATPSSSQVTPDYAQKSPLAGSEPYGILGMEPPSPGLLECKANALQLCYLSSPSSC